MDTWAKEQVNPVGLTQVVTPANNAGLQGVGTSSDPLQFCANNLPTTPSATGDKIVVSSTARPCGELRDQSSIKAFTANADTGTSNINLGDNLAIIGDTDTKIKTAITAPNTLKVSLDTTGATLGQVPTVNATGGITYSSPTVTDDAIEVNYDNTATSAPYANVQEALDTMIPEIATLQSNSHPAATVPAGNPALTINPTTQVANLDLTVTGSFDNVASGLTADNVQGAIDELASSTFTSPLTTKGDIYVNDGTTDTRMPVGTDGQVLIASSGSPNGLKYTNFPTQFATGADNGTTVGVDGNVELGGALHQTTEIATSGFDLNFNTASATDTQIKDNGDVVVGGNDLTIKGDTNTSLVVLRVGSDLAPNSNFSIIQQATKDTGTGNILVENKQLNASSLNVSESIEQPFIHKIRGYLVDGAGSLKNLLGSSPTGKLFLSQTGWATGTATPSELPVTSSASTVETLGIDTANGQLVRYDSNPKYIYGGTTAIYPTTAIIDTTDNITFPGIVRTIPVGSITPPFAAPTGKNWKASINMWLLPIVLDYADFTRMEISTLVNGSLNTSATGYGNASNDMLTHEQGYLNQPYVIEYSAIFNINSGTNPLAATFNVVRSGGVALPTYNYNVFNVRWQASLELYNN